MTSFEVWKKVIKAKVYTKEVVIQRINVVFAVGQLTPDEYAELMNLIDDTYDEAA